LPTDASNIAPEEEGAGDQIVRKPQDNGASSDGNAIVSGSAPSEGEASAATRARNEEPKVPFLQLMQQAAEIGWTLPTPEAGRAATTTTGSNALEPRQGSVEKPTPTRPAQSAAIISAEITETSAKEPATPVPASGGPIDDEAKALDSNQAKASKAPNRADVPEQPAPTHATPRAAEALAQTSTNPPINATPNLQPQAPDTVSVPQPASISAPAANSADMPVKLMATSREEQTAEMQTLALHIAARSAKGDSKFAIRLDPPELGQIDVNLSVNSHGHAQAVLAVEKPQTLDLLLRDAPTLERALKDAGLELGGNLSFSLKEEGQQGFARNDQYSPPSKTLELVPTEAPKAQAALNASMVEHLYGLRTARLDITV
jgi:flagellar hook-length control protein FliK